MYVHSNAFTSSPSNEKPRNLLHIAGRWDGGKEAEAFFSLLESFCEFNET